MQHESSCLVYPPSHLAPHSVQIPLVPAGQQLTGRGAGKKGTSVNKKEQTLEGKGTKKSEPTSEGLEGAEDEDMLLDRPLWSYVSEGVTRTLGKGLGDRCVLARPLCGAAGEAAEDFQGTGRRVLRA